ncbi:MAG: T9SS type A sorting domain-containing protein [Bacteroidetes bacterium]|nr:T9SS type A sorting domain-containing protein [Bacteroidota bacterium]
MIKRILTLTLILFPALVINALKFDVDTVSMKGTIDDCINIVFLPDGYQEEELDKFSDDVDWMIDALFGKEPYPEYRDYFNCFAIQVPSEESGAANDPDSLINNYFGSCFNNSGIWRLVVPRRSSKVQSVLQDNFPQYDQVVVVVNDSRYGGSGGWMATSTTHSNGPEICIHEIGHSFAGLSDEYWAGAGYARENINMTQETDPSVVRWKDWMGFRSVGIYSHSEDPSWKRPHQNCEMRYLNRNFCPVCQEAIASRILDLVNPIRSFSPQDEEFTLVDPWIDFSVELLKPNPNTLSLRWMLNSDSIAGNVDSIRIQSENFLPSSNRLAVFILDTTDYIRKSSHSRMHQSIVIWDFTNSSSGIHPQITKEKINLEIYPNPATEYIRVSFDLEQDQTFGIELIGQAGKQVRLIAPEIRIAGHYDEKINLIGMGLSSGLYHLKVMTNGNMVTLPLIIN